MSTRRIVIIVGCEGFIGKKLLDKLSSGNQIDILGIDKTVKENYVKQNVSILKLKVLKPGDINSIKYFLIKRNSGEICIVHLAGASGVWECQNNQAESYRLNIESLKNICGIASDFNVKRIIFSSSALVYGTKYKEDISEEFLVNPETAYAKNKVEAEDYLLNNFPDKTVILRFPNIYGSGGHKDTVVATVLEQLKDNYLQLKEYVSIRDFLYIKDVVSAFELVLSCAPSYAIYNVGTSIGYSIYDLCVIAARVLRKERLLTRQKENSQIVNKLVLLSERMKNDFSWRASYSLESGIREMAGVNG